MPIQKRVLERRRDVLKQSGFVHLRGNIYSIEMEHYTVDVLLRPSSDLVVCFDHAGIAENNLSRRRLGWGFNFVREHTDMAGVFVKPTESNWFRPSGLYDLCEKLAGLGFSQTFNSVLNYGGSMGGYAALAYADAFQADKVLAMNPQATLASEIVPWEKRFPRGRNQEWSSWPVNAADGCKSSKKVILVFDRRCAEDAAHIKLLNIPNATELNIPFVGHGVPYHLSKMGLLERLFSDVAQNTFDLTNWRRNVRKRRSLDAYKDRISAYLNTNFRA